MCVQHENTTKPIRSLIFLDSNKLFYFIELIVRYVRYGADRSIHRRGEGQLDLTAVSIKRTALKGHNVLSTT